jgi:hypothetical protein
MSKMPRKDDRTVLSPIGEWYEDLLAADATVNARSVAFQGSSLLCAKLQEREKLIKERVEYLAKKRGIPFDECWKLCVTGKLEKITPDEWSNMPGQEDESNK